MPVVEIPPETLDMLDLAAAAVAEGETPAALLPDTPVDELLVARSEELAAVLRAELHRGFTVGKPEILSVSKPTRGRRPVAVLTARERVLYRALTAALGSNVPEPDRGSDAYETFKRGPLDWASASFVLLADISSCYQYIDHQVIHQEIISRTADPFLAEAIVSFLQALGGQTFGLPQNREASHRLAELVLSIPERSLRRAGHQVWRYSDDFRVASASRARANEALEDLDSALGMIGLTLNDEKTLIKSISDYREWAHATERRFDEIQNAATVELIDFTYDGDVIEPDRVELMSESAGRLLELWRGDIQLAQNQYGPAAVVGRQILTVALGVLGAVGDTRALDACSEVLDREPSLTPAVARYMRAQLPASEDAFDAAFDAMLERADQYLSPWQCLWLMEPLKSSSLLTAAQANWLKSLLDSRGDYLRASAALVAARHSVAPVRDLARSFDRSSSASRPLLVYAVALHPSKISAAEMASLTDEDPIFKWIEASVPSATDVLF